MPRPAVANTLPTSQDHPRPYLAAPLRPSVLQQRSTINPAGPRLDGHCRSLYIHSPYHSRLLPTPQRLKVFVPLHNDRLRIHLAQGPRPARLLQEVMQISQPTLSRAVAQLGREIVRIGAARSIRYALRDTTRGFLDVPVYQVNSQGQLLHLGTLIPVRPDGFVMQRSDGTADYTEGVPW